MQVLTIAGNVGKDSELRTTQSGEQVLSFSVACDNGKDRNGNRRDSTWYEASIWGKRASSLSDHIKKGTKLTLTGRPSAREYNGKAYLQISVHDLTFQGGGQSGGQSQGSGPAGNTDMDDEIPF